jgi:hypothetical protein
MIDIWLLSGSSDFSWYYFYYHGYNSSFTILLLSLLIIVWSVFFWFARGSGPRIRSALDSSPLRGSSWWGSGRKRSLTLSGGGWWSTMRSPVRIENDRKGKDSRSEFILYPIPNGAKEIAFSMWKTNKLTPFGVYKLVLSHIQMKETE